MEWKLGGMFALGSVFGMAVAAIKVNGRPFAAGVAVGCAFIYLVFMYLEGRRERLSH